MVVLAVVGVAVDVGLFLASAVPACPRPPLWVFDEDLAPIGLGTFLPGTPASFEADPAVEGVGPLCPDEFFNPSLVPDCSAAGYDPDSLLVPLAPLDEG